MISVRSLPLKGGGSGWGSRRTMSSPSKCSTAAERWSIGGLRSQFLDHYAGAKPRLWCSLREAVGWVNKLRADDPHPDPPPFRGRERTETAARSHTIPIRGYTSLRWKLLG